MPGDHQVFVCGDDADAKVTVEELLGSLGWPADRVIDLGGLSGARATETYVLFWVYVRIALGSNDFNIQVHGA